MSTPHSTSTPISRAQSVNDSFVRTFYIEGYGGTAREVQREVVENTLSYSAGTSQGSIIAADDVRPTHLIEQSIMMRQNRKWFRSYFDEACDLLLKVPLAELLCETFTYFDLSVAP